MTEEQPDLDVLRRAPAVINIGLELFAAALERQGVPVAQVAWAPPAKGDPELMSLLDDLL